MQTMVGADSTLNGCLVTGNGAKTALHNPRLEAPRPASASQNVGLHLNKRLRMRPRRLGKGMKHHLLTGKGGSANMAKNLQSSAVSGRLEAIKTPNVMGINALEAVN
jgi:hypothetical protein